jgi:Fe-S-cluster containining protein
LAAERFRAKPLKPKIDREKLKPGACLCDHCTGKCCRYFSLPIDEPTTWDDFDAIRWYLAHGQTIIYVDKGTWYLLVMTRCKYLSRDFRCSIYLNRPKICREYTTDDCEYDDDWGFDKVFECPEQIWEYAEAVLHPRRKPLPNGGALVHINGNAKKV